MGAIIRSEQTSHWYAPNHQEGTFSPLHEVPKADGKGMRATTLRDARKFGLYPSVTNRMAVMSKPGLERWKIEQALLSAITLPRLKDEEPDAFLSRVLEDMDKERDRAAKFGSEIHKALEDHLGGKLSEDNLKHSSVYPFVISAMGWVKDHFMETIGTEICVGNHSLRYAGTLDFMGDTVAGKLAIVDFKTQNIKEGREAVFYDDWAIQLSAYAQCPVHNGNRIIAGFPVELYSVVIDSNMPGPCSVKQWENPESYFRAFQAACTIWDYRNDF